MRKKTTTGISGCLMILLFLVKVFEQIHNGFIEYIPNNEEQYGNQLSNDCCYVELQKVKNLCNYIF